MRRPAGRTAQVLQSSASAESAKVPIAIEAGERRDALFAIERDITPLIYPMAFTGCVRFTDAQTPTVAECTHKQTRNHASSRLTLSSLVSHCEARCA
jgi:hypothetical protein